MIIRPETCADLNDIYSLTKAAFAPMPFSQGDEQDCINKLRDDGDLTNSNVAVSEAGEIVGHIAFSPVFLDGKPGNWFGLGHVSAKPDLQRTGIGSALINDGLTRLKEMNATGCVLIGDPNYYCRFGFVGDGRITYRDLPKEIVKWLSLSDEKPSGRLTYSPGLE